MICCFHFLVENECVCTDGCSHGDACEIECNNLGVCVDGTCDCTNTTTNLNHGFWGQYCTEVGCPGASGFECNDRSASSGFSELCSRDTLECACVPGFNGIACEDFYCGLDEDPPCNGHGTCTLDDGLDAVTN